MIPLFPNQNNPSPSSGSYTKSGPDNFKSIQFDSLTQEASFLDNPSEWRERDYDKIMNSNFYLSSKSNFYKMKKWYLYSLERMNLYYDSKYRAPSFEAKLVEFYRRKSFERVWREHEDRMMHVNLTDFKENIEEIRKKTSDNLFLCVEVLKYYDLVNKYRHSVVKVDELLLNLFRFFKFESYTAKDFHILESFQKNHELFLEDFLSQTHVRITYKFYLFKNGMNTTISYKNDEVNMELSEEKDVNGLPHIVIKKKGSTSYTLITDEDGVYRVSSAMDTNWIPFLFNKLMIVKDTFPSLKDETIALLKSLYPRRDHQFVHTWKDMGESWNAFSEFLTENDEDMERIYRFTDEESRLNFAIDYLKPFESRKNSEYISFVTATDPDSNFVTSENKPSKLLNSFQHRLERLKLYGI